MKEKKNALKGLIFVVGLIAVLIGGMTNLYDAKYGALAALIIWLLGGALVSYFSADNVNNAKAQVPEDSPDNNLVEDAN